MRYTVNLTSKGQMTLPKAAREKIGVKPRGQVVVEIGKKDVKIQKAPELEDIWRLTETTKRWPGDRAVDRILAKTKKSDYGRAKKNRS